MSKKNKSCMDFGGLLQGIAPLLNLVPGGQALAPVASMAGGLISQANQQNQAAPILPRQQNTNPYGYAEGGLIDPPKKKRYTDSAIKVKDKIEEKRKKVIVDENPKSNYALITTSGPSGNTGETKPTPEPVKYPIEGVIREDKQSMATHKLSAITSKTGSFGAVTGLDAALQLPGQIEMMFKQPTAHNAVGTGLNILQLIPYLKMAKLATAGHAAELVPNANSFYRVVGRDAAEDYFKNGIIRARQQVESQTKGINLGARPTAWPSFSPGSPNMSYAEGLPEAYIIETQHPMGVSTVGRHGKGTTYFPIDENSQYLKEFSHPDIKVYGKNSEGKFVHINKLHQASGGYLDQKGPGPKPAKPKYPTKYTTDPNDPKIQAYQDSLNLYNNMLSNIGVDKIVAQQSGNDSMTYEKHIEGNKFKTITQRAEDYFKTVKNKINSDIKPYAVFEVQAPFESHKEKVIVDGEERNTTGLVNRAVYAYDSPTQPWEYKKPEAPPGKYIKKDGKLIPIDDAKYQETISSGKVETSKTGKIYKPNNASGGYLDQMGPMTQEVIGNNPQVKDGVELPNAYVDHGETISDTPQGKYVFSDILKNPLTGNTFATDDKKLASSDKAASKKPYDVEAQNTLKINEKMRQQLATVNDITRGLTDLNKMCKGGYMKGMANGGYIKPNYNEGGALKPFNVDNFYKTVEGRKALQNMLEHNGFSVGKYGVDGVLGRDTGEAVRAFQKQHGLKVDGILGNETIKALENTYNKKSASSKVSTNQAPVSENKVPVAKTAFNKISDTPTKQQSSNPNKTFLNPAEERDFWQKLSDITTRPMKAFERGDHAVGNATGVYGLMRTPDNIRDMVQDPSLRNIGKTILDILPLALHIPITKNIPIYPGLPAAGEATVPISGALPSGIRALPPASLPPASLGMAKGGYMKPSYENGGPTYQTGYQAPWAGFNIGEFQQYAGLKGDNIYGPKTHQALQGDLGKQYAAQYGYAWDPQMNSYLPAQGYSTPSMNPNTSVPTAEEALQLINNPFNAKPSGLFKDAIDLSNLDLVPPTSLPTDNTALTSNNPVTLSRFGVGVDSKGNPLSSVNDNGTNSRGNNLGTGLQLASLLGKGIGVAKRPEKQNLYLNNAPITNQTYDPSSALNRSQYSFNALAQGINNSVGDASRVSNLQQAYANKTRNEGDIVTRYSEMNKQAQRDYEARLAQRNAENNQYKYNVDQINSQNKAARNNGVRGFLTDIGNLGAEVNNQKTNKQAVQWIMQAYPDIAKYFKLNG